MAKIKQKPSIIERAWNSVKGIKHSLDRGALRREQRAQKNTRDKIKSTREDLQKRYRTIESNNPDLSTSQLNLTVNNDPVYMQLLARHVRLGAIDGRHTKEIEKISKKMDKNTSSKAALERLVDPSYTYSSVRSLLVDRAIVEVFSADGISSFDLKIKTDKVVGIKNEEEIQSILLMSKEERLESVKTLNQEQIEQIFAFGDAKLLGQAIQPDGEEATCFGDELISRLISIRDGNIDGAKEHAATGKEIVACVDKTIDIESVCKIAEVLTGSAVEHYHAMTDVLETISAQ
ncbi:MAG: hypothetical protein IJD48_00195 [Clostridia bacterium]|nr:hypothetical protein [Clostridia bacterium]